MWGRKVFILFCTSIPWSIIEKLEQKLKEGTEAKAIKDTIAAFNDLLRLFLLHDPPEEERSAIHSEVDPPTVIHQEKAPTDFLQASLMEATLQMRHPLHRYV